VLHVTSRHAASPAAFLPIAVALLLLTAVFIPVVRSASVAIDGTRYYFLDDDQMISMRYARNLVEGHGLVWNPGERVEGYTNFGWVVVMAAVHAAGAPDRLAPLFVKIVNGVLACAIVVFSDRLFRRFVREPPVFLRAALLITIALSVDVLYWAVNGFETTLLTALFLWALARSIDDARRGELSALTCLVAGLLPVVRADAPDLTAVVVVAGFVLGARRRLWLAAFAIAPFILHLTFRVWYYGDWLPNTYYLKVADHPDHIASGLGYLKGCIATYPVAFVLAAIAPFVARDRRVPIVLLSLLFVLGRLVMVGGDIFGNARFLAPALPVVIAMAGICIAAVTASGADMAARVLAIVLLVSTMFTAGINGRRSIANLVSGNGWPRANTIAGHLIERYSQPEARIAVFAAGAAGYFSRRYAIDMLGKTDREIARVPPRVGPPLGHDRFDMEISLGKRPDFVLSSSRAVPLEDFAAALKYQYGDEPTDYRYALLTNRIFVKHFQRHLVPFDYFTQNNAIYVSDESPELARLAAWRFPSIER
jgi:hypothetical protein